jgi:pimeloyl-ACP methyl ester carboxylesterase
MLLTVQANGLAFACLEEGRGPLVLLLHGFPDTAHSWDRTRPALARAGFRAVSPFMRGYAPTEIPRDGDYRIDTLARDVGALIAALGEDEAIVVGHDWGASAAYGAAILYPDRVRFLVTVAIPHPASLRPSPVLLWKMRHFLSLRRRGAADRLRADGLVHVDELLRRWSPAWTVPPDASSAVKRAFSVPGCLEAALGYYRALTPRLPASQRGPIRMPSLAFAGATDFALRVSDFERARRFYEDTYEVVSLPGGHFLHREHPEEFNAELLARLPQATAAAGS